MSGLFFQWNSRLRKFCTIRSLLHFKFCTYLCKYWQQLLYRKGGDLVQAQEQHASGISYLIINAIFQIIKAKMTRYHNVILAIIYKQNQTKMKEQLTAKINGNWIKIQPKNQDTSLIWRLRKNHAVIHYKHYIIFYGGEPMTPPHLLPNISPEDMASQGQHERLQEVNFHNYLHRFDYYSKEWQRWNLNLTSFGSGSAQGMNSLEYLSEHSALIINNFIYVFGGVNYKTGVFRSPQLWTINADSYILKRIDSKGMAPTSRSNSSMFLLNKTSILLFGGSNGNEYLNDIYIYRLDFKNWQKVEQSYQYSLPKLISPSITVLGDNCFYLYGGFREMSFDTEIEKIPNYQFYKFKIITKTVTTRPDCEVQKIIQNLPPIEAFSGQLLNFNDKYLALLNHDFNIGRIKSIWFFNPEDVLWTQVRQSSLETQNLIKSSATFLAVGDQIYACNQNIFTLTMDQSLLVKDIYETAKVTAIENCAMCQSENYNFMVPKKIPLRLFQRYLEPLSFAYAAIGLLVDNCLLSKSNKCNIYFSTTSSTPSQKYIVIEDNGEVSNIWGAEVNDFSDCIDCFYSGCLDSVFSELDYRQQTKETLKDLQKKQKKQEKEYQQFLKQQKTANNPNNPNYNVGNYGNANVKNEKDYEKDLAELVEKRKHLEYKNKLLKIKTNQQKYSSNLKLGGMRLGNLVIYASKEKVKEQNTGESVEIRRYAFINLEKESEDEKQREDFYLCHHYVTRNGICPDSTMDYTMKYMSKKYRKELRIIQEKFKYMNSVVYIGNLKKKYQILKNEGQKSEVASISEFYFRKKINDVYLGNSEIISNFATMHNINVGDFCDISLKSYLSLLYTKNQEMIINLAVKDNPLQIIVPQQFLGIIDKLNKAKKILPIDQCLDFQCRIVEVYYTGLIFEDDNIKPDHSFINNGILIYSEGRLVSRFKIDLGEMIDDRNKELINKPKLFGYIEVNDYFIVNTFKTGFLYSTALEPFFSRLNFMFEYLRRNKSPWKIVRDRKEDVSMGNKPSKKVKTN